MWGTQDPFQHPTMSFRVSSPRHKIWLYGKQHCTSAGYEDLHIEQLGRKGTSVSKLCRQALDNMPCNIKDITKHKWWFYGIASRYVQLLHEEYRSSEERSDIPTDMKSLWLSPHGSCCTSKGKARYTCSHPKSCTGVHCHTSTKLLLRTMTFQHRQGLQNGHCNCTLTQSGHRVPVRDITDLV